MVVATYRSDELHRRHPLRPFLAEMERVDQVERIDLNPFSRLELTAQLTGILDTPPDATAIDDLFERTEGNPSSSRSCWPRRRAGRARPSRRRFATR